ncbi:hypothetical protein N5079_32645 [Planotetraspora sp. A-T 1434]|uniref:hypothetical protein n=1 Tax=Planotetraspora sp. A-T 1434 TaxID=2979219 RepID=UPI0021C12985|nr:hypothetical protein [Planotetraspora sp. A-T 1434]MCT9934965.1 hypothetical protein [Planotetraspora sp. A-T 1434]
MVRETVDIEYPDGTDLGRSRKADGGRSPLAYAAGDLVTQVVIYERDEDEEGDEGARDQLAGVILVGLGFAAGVLGTIVVVKNAPRIKRWWNDTALPAIRSKWNGIAESSEADSQTTSAETATLSGLAPTDFSKEVDAVLEDFTTSMSSAEAQARPLSILVAAAFIAEQMRALSNARIEVKDDDVLVLKGAMGKLMTQQVTDGINLILATNASLLNEETSAELMKIFAGGRVVDGEYVPLSNERIKDALRLTN